MILQFSLAYLIQRLYLVHQKLVQVDMPKFLQFIAAVDLQVLQVQRDLEIDDARV